MIDFMDPRFKYLLKEKEALPSGKEARELLLSGNFIELMLKDARNDETRFRSDRVATAMAKGKSLRGHGCRPAASGPPPNHS